MCVCVRERERERERERDLHSEISFLEAYDTYKILNCKLISYGAAGQRNGRKGFSGKSNAIDYPAAGNGETIEITIDCMQKPASCTTQHDNPLQTIGTGWTKIREDI